MRVVTTSVLSLLACASRSPTETGDTAPEAATPWRVETVRDALEAGALVEGDSVILPGVVATTGVSAGADAFFVQDAGGGAQSGIRVHLGPVLDPVPARPGAVVDLGGTIAFYDGVPEIALAAASDVVRTGSADPVADRLSCGATDPAPWEGGLVVVADLLTTEAEDAYGEIPTACGVTLDDLFTDLGLAGGTFCAEVTGVILRIRGAYRLAPRDAEDLRSCVRLHSPPVGPARRIPCVVRPS
ncbi:MAG: hypothetical protein JXB39_13600 [Deltaproteobacteria bacterium]|nr:hypothetical protein [Deltaproteobacteria bacterium]